MDREIVICSFWLWKKTKSRLVSFSWAHKTFMCLLLKKVSMCVRYCSRLPRHRDQGNQNPCLHNYHQRGAFHSQKVTQKRSVRGLLYRRFLKDKSDFSLGDQEGFTSEGLMSGYLNATGPSYSFYLFPHLPSSFYFTSTTSKILMKETMVPWSLEWNIHFSPRNDEVIPHNVAIRENCIDGRAVEGFILLGRQSQCCLKDCLLIVSSHSQPGVWSFARKKGEKMRRRWMCEREVFCFKVRD